MNHHLNGRIRRDVYAYTTRGIPHEMMFNVPEILVKKDQHLARFDEVIVKCCSHLTTLPYFLILILIIIKTLRKCAPSHDPPPLQQLI